MRLVWEEDGGARALALGPDEEHPPPPVSPPPAGAEDERTPHGSILRVVTHETAFPNPVGAFRTDVRSAWIDALFGSTDFAAVHQSAAETTTAAAEPVAVLAPSLFAGDEAGSSGGKDRPKVPVVEGVGRAGVPSFVAYGAVIPAGARASSPPTTTTPNASPAKSVASRGGSGSKSVASSATTGPTTAASSGEGDPPRLGITLSRIPLGVYVRSVAATSEAYFAGILPGSILVDINGLGVLGEPTHKLLERLWQYENVAGGGGGAGGGGMGARKEGDTPGRSSDGPSSPPGSGSNSTSSSSQYCTYGNIQGPVALRFYRDGRLSTAILLGRAPFGISWGPCGNFALVQRSYSFAEGAGVRRGSLVAAVNGRCFRDMDHVDAAEELRRLFVGGEQIALTLVFTPSASRPGSQERNRAAKGDDDGDGGSSGKKASAKKKDRGGITVKLKRAPSSAEKARKPHPLEGVLNCGTGKEYLPEAPADLLLERAMASGGRAGISPSAIESISELAVRVAAGSVVAPTFGFGKRGSALSFGGEVSRYKDCPALPKGQLVKRWNALESLVYCVVFHCASFNEDNFQATGAPSRDCGDGSDGRIGGISHVDEMIAMLERMASAKGAGDVFGWYLIQCVCLLSSPDFVNALKDETLAAEGDQGEESSTYSGSRSRAIVDLISTKEVGKKIMGILLSIAANDNQMCQRLHFLLRSFLASMGDQDGVFNVQYSAQQMLQDAQQQLLMMLEDQEATPTASSRASPKSNKGEHSAENASDDPTLNRVEALLDQVYGPAVSRERSELRVSRVLEKYQGREDLLVEVLTEKVKESGNSGEVAEATTNGDAGVEQITQGVLDASIDQAVATPSPKKKKGVTKKIVRLIRTGSMKKKRSSSNLAVITGSDLDDGRAKLMENGAGSFDILPLPSSDSYLRSAPSAILSSLNVYFNNMEWLLERLESTCDAVEGSLLKSVSQKIAEWALQPWSESKDQALAKVTAEMRNELHRINADSADETMSRLPLLNPIDSSELLFLLEPEESFILPSAHFPLLLCFNSTRANSNASLDISPVCAAASIPDKTALLGGQQILYRTKVEVIALHSSGSGDDYNSHQKCAYAVHAAIAGVIKQTGSSTVGVPTKTSSYRWTEENVLSFESRSSWGGPKTLSMKLASLAVTDEGKEKLQHTDVQGRLHYSMDAGYCWVDLSSLWDRVIPPADSLKVPSTQVTVRCHAQISSPPPGNGDEFDHSGYPTHSAKHSSQKMEIELKITNERVSLSGDLPQRRMLLYKHDDDMRQEVVAIEFIEACDRILRASGLDLKLVTYRCLAVGDKKGFIEWMNGTVPLSEICKASGGGSGSTETPRTRSEFTLSSGFTLTSGPEDQPNGGGEPSGNVQEENATNPGLWCKYESLRGVTLGDKATKPRGKDVYANNPVQDFLRASAYDADAPYYIRKDVMDTYVRSCAGYSIITYLLGVGDRHLDNLLLHPEGYFLHCDYSFILGQDPKTYLPMRITENMVLGMGGRNGDNFAKFLSLAGAAFVALRRHSNVRLLMSLIRNVTSADLPDVSKNQSPEDALMSMRYRFRLDLDEIAALSFIERLIESSIDSKIWIAVDAIHQFGKRF